MDGDGGRHVPRYDTSMRNENRMTRAATRTTPIYTVGVKQYRDALRDAVELPITTRGVLYVLAQWMNVDGTNAYPRLGRLAASCQLRQRALAKHLSTAVQAGYLHRTSEGHKGSTAVYRAAIPQYRWDPDNKRLVQPNPVVEPPQRMHQRAAFDV